MSQKASLAINAVLAIAVIFLFVKVYSGNETPVHADTKTDTTVSNDTSKVDEPRVAPTGKIAFVNSEVINEKYEYLTDKKKVLEKQQASVQAQLKSKMEKAMKREQEIQKSAQFMTMTEQKAAQEELMKLGQDYQMTEERMLGDLQKMEIEFQTTLQKNVEDLLSRYAKENGIDYIFSYIPGMQLLYGNREFDITDVILEKLNEEYRAAKQ